MQNQHIEIIQKLGIKNQALISRCLDSGLICDVKQLQQIDALTSLTYNIGVGNFINSTLLRQLNRGEYGKAAEQFSVWNKIRVNGKLQVSRGLTNRRNSEQELFYNDH